MSLKPVDHGPAVVVCNSCRHSTIAQDDAEGASGGMRLAEALRAVKCSDDRYEGVAVQDMTCLFACTEFCTVHLRAPGKIGYVLGRFRPDEDAARAILDYAAHYAESEHGQVPYSLWPDGVKGHFIVRTSPPGFVAD